MDRGAEREEGPAAKRPRLADPGDLDTVEERIALGETGKIEQVLGGDCTPVCLYDDMDTLPEGR